MPYKYGQDAGLSQTGKRLRHDKLAKESGKMTGILVVEQIGPCRWMRLARRQGKGRQAGRLGQNQAGSQACKYH